MNCPLPTTDLFAYVVEHDTGFAPNPYGGYCTLACDQARIRRSARVGDWVIGTAPGLETGAEPDRLVFAMQVTRALTFNQYWCDPSYSAKKPSPAIPYGDNIYQPDGSGGLKVAAAATRKPDEAAFDLACNRVLISEEFYYFGGGGPRLPRAFRDLAHVGKGYQRTLGRGPGEGHDAIPLFVSWLASSYSRGVHGRPAGVSSC